MFFFRILKILEKNRKRGKLENLGKIGLLHRGIGNPRCGVDVRQGMGHPHRCEAEVPKWNPSSCYASAKAYAAT